MDKDQEWAEINSLRTAIEDAAFQKQTFRFEKRAEEESQLYSKKAVDRAKKAFNDRGSEKAIKERGKPIHRSKPELVYYKEKHSHREKNPELAFCSRIRDFNPSKKRFVKSIPFKSSLNKTSHLEIFDLAEMVDTFSLGTH